MTIWIRKGTDAVRVDGIRLFGRPPVLAPPAWAVCERVWEGTGSSAGHDRGSDLGPSAEALVEAIPSSARRIVLVVPDGTRTGPWRDFLPVVLERMQARFQRRGQYGAPAGAPTDAVTSTPEGIAPVAEDAANKSGVRRTLLIAGGVHAPHTPDGLRAHLPDPVKGVENLLEDWSVQQNGDNDFRDHREVGRTAAGTVIRLHPEYVRADWRILLGEISYHYFAGFGGGRKLVFPGLGEPRGIVVNHRRALRRVAAAIEAPVSGAEAPDVGATDASDLLENWCWNEPCAPGRLSGNPVHEDLDDAARLAPPHWVATLVEEPPADPDPGLPAPFPVRVVQGPYPAALDEAAVAYEKGRRIAFTTAPAVLITDAGGGPRDVTFLQAHKSLQHAARFVPRGARVLLAAACNEGLGSATLARYAADPGGFRPSAKSAEDPMSVVHLQTLVALRRVVSTRRVGLWSDLPETTVRSLGLEPLPDLGTALAWCASPVEGVPGWGWLPRAERFLPRPGWMGGGLGGSAR